MNSVPVFLLPFAGANRNSYRILAASLERVGIRPAPLELPGHGARVAEPLCGTIREMEQDLLPQIASTGSGHYALFGHSMGALLAYRLALRCREAGNMPLCLIVSGRAAPVVPLRRPPIHALETGAFIEEIRRFGGSPDEILNDGEMIEFFEPILRADFRAVETYRHEDAPPLPIPITVVRGVEDTIGEEEAQRWEEVSESKAQVVTMDGGHFHILERPDETARIIRQSILATL